MASGGDKTAGKRAAVLSNRRSSGRLIVSCDQKRTRAPIVNDRPIGSYSCGKVLPLSNAVPPVSIPTSLSLARCDTPIAQPAVSIQPKVR